MTSPNGHRLLERQSRRTGGGVKRPSPSPGRFEEGDLRERCLSPGLLGRGTRVPEGGVQREAVSGWVLWWRGPVDYASAVQAVHYTTNLRIGDIDDVFLRHCDD